MAKIDFPKKQEQRLIPKYLLEYAEELQENHPDPSAEWGGGGTPIEAGTGIEITGDETKTISIDTDTVALKTDIPDTTNMVTTNTNQTITGEKTFTDGVRYSLVIDENSVEAIDTQTQDATAIFPQSINHIGGDLDVELDNGTYTFKDNKTGDVALTSDIITSYNDLTDKPDLSIYAESADLATVATTGDYDDLLNKPTIPDVQANVGSTPTATLTDIAIDGVIYENPIFSGSYNDLTDKPTIPTKTSELTNDSGYITSSDLPTNHVTTDTAQNITGEKTFVGTKRIKFKESAVNDKLGFTCYDPWDTEIGFLEASGYKGGSGTYIPNIHLGMYYQGNTSSTATNRRDVKCGLAYYNSLGSDGNAHAFKLDVPNLYNLNDYNTSRYIPIDFTDGTNTVRSDATGIVNISTLIPTVPTVNNDLITIELTSNSGTLTADELSNITSNKEKVIIYGRYGGYNYYQALYNSSTSSNAYYASTEYSANPGSGMVRYCVQVNIDTTTGAYTVNAVDTGLAFKNWVTTQGYITGITSTDVTQALGYIPGNVIQSNNKINLSTNALEGHDPGININGKNSDPLQAYVQTLQEKDGTIALTSDIPTKTSDLTNDSGFIDNSVNNLTNYTLTSNLATVATSGSYNDLSNKPTLPTANVLFSRTQDTGTSTTGLTTITLSDAITNYDYIVIYYNVNDAITMKQTYTWNKPSVNDKIDLVYESGSGTTTPREYMKLTRYTASSTTQLTFNSDYQLRVGNAEATTGNYNTDQIRNRIYSIIGYSNAGHQINTVGWDNVTGRPSFAYANGDTYENKNYYQLYGYATNGGKDIQLTVIVPKSLASISSVTVNKIAIVTRGVAGYVGATSYTDYAADTTNYTVTALISSDNAITITIRATAAWSNVTNNTPVCAVVQNVAGALKLTFNT